MILYYNRFLRQNQFPNVKLSYNTNLVVVNNKNNTHNAHSVPIFDLKLENNIVQ
jgi:hypothetical protein